MQRLDRIGASDAMDQTTRDLLEMVVMLSPRRVWKWLLRPKSS